MLLKSAYWQPASGINYAVQFSINPINRKEIIMKIVITAQGESPNSEIDPRFGRAKNFIIYDTDTDEYSLLSNEGAQATHGAGIQTGRTVADTGAKFVITGNCGPKAFQVLQAAGIQVYTGATGTVSDMVEAFKRGDLKEAQSASVKGHW